MEDRLSFKLWSKEVSYHSDLKKYLFEQAAVKEKYNHIMDILLEKIQIQAAPKTILPILQRELDELCGNTIVRLASYKFFDRTKDEYLDGNAGYIRLLSITDSSEKDIEKVRDDAQRAMAYTLLNSMQAELDGVRGLDFGVITSSVTSAMVYDSMNEAETRKQLLRASQNYEMAEKDITRRYSNQEEANVAKYYMDNYAPAVVDCVIQFFSEYSDLYYGDLQRCGILNIDCLEGINEDRASKLLENLPAIEDKASLLETVLQIYPANVNAYIEAFRFGLFNEGLANLCEFAMLKLEVKKTFDKIIIESEKQDEVEKAIKAMACIVHIPHEQVARNYFQDECERVISKFKELATESSSLSITTLAKKFKYPNVDEAVDKYVLAIATPDRIKWLSIFCGFSDIIDTLASLINLPSGLGCESVLTEYKKRISTYINAIYEPLAQEKQLRLDEADKFIASLEERKSQAQEIMQRAEHVVMKYKFSIFGDNARKKNKAKRRIISLQTEVDKITNDIKKAESDRRVIAQTPLLS